MKNLTLVVMAAGMGSRFGGLKQITPVDNNGNFLIDYSVFDALKAGFQKVVFIIKKENFEVFKDTIGKRLEEKIKVEYAFQELEDVPDFVQIPKERVKPWGTVHAVLAAKSYVDGPFAIINADDFYGFSSYFEVANFLRNEENNDYSVSIPYPFSTGESKYGVVKRGVLSLDEDHVLDILECSILHVDDKLLATPLNGGEAFFISSTQPVSMNMFGFQKNIFDDLEKYFVSFLKENEGNLEKCECLIPEFLGESLKKKKIFLKYRLSDGLWLGMTYKEDLDDVRTQLEKLKENGEYPEHLWEE